MFYAALAAFFLVFIVIPVGIMLRDVFRAEGDIDRSGVSSKHGVTRK